MFQKLYQLCIKGCKHTLYLLVRVIVTPIICIPASLLSAPKTLLYYKKQLGVEGLLRMNPDRRRTLEQRAYTERGYGMSGIYPAAQVIIQFLTFTSSMGVLIRSIIATLGDGDISSGFGIQGFFVFGNTMIAMCSKEYFETMWDQILIPFQYYLLCNVNVQNRLGDTAIHRALYRDDLTEFEKLFNKGASLTIRNNLGFTPIDLIKQLGNLYAYNVLRQDALQKIRFEVKKSTQFQNGLVSTIIEYLDWKRLPGRVNEHTLIQIIPQSRTPILTPLFDTKEPEQNGPPKIDENFDIFKNPEIEIEIEEPEKLEEPEKEKKSVNNQYTLLPG